MTHEHHKENSYRLLGFIYPLFFIYKSLLYHTDTALGLESNKNKLSNNAKKILVGYYLSYIAFDIYSRNKKLNENKSALYKFMYSLDLTLWHLPSTFVLPFTYMNCVPQVLPYIASKGLFWIRNVLFFSCLYLTFGTFPRVVR